MAEFGFWSPVLWFQLLSQSLSLTETISLSDEVGGEDPSLRGLSTVILRN